MENQVIALLYLLWNSVNMISVASPNQYILHQSPGTPAFSPGPALSQHPDVQHEKCQSSKLVWVVGQKYF